MSDIYELRRPELPGTLWVRPPDLGSTISLETISHAQFTLLYVDVSISLSPFLSLSSYLVFYLSIYYIYLSSSVSLLCVGLRHLSRFLLDYLYIYLHVRPLGSKSNRILDSLMSALSFLSLFIKFFCKKNYIIIFGMIVYYLQITNRSTCHILTKVR